MKRPLKILLQIIVFALVLGGLTKSAINGACLFQKLSVGETSCVVSPSPFYGYMPLPSNLSYGASGKFSADFASLYFAAKNYLKTTVMYNTQVDPFQRPAVTFPPHLIYTVAQTIGRLDFSEAAEALVGFQFFIFFLVSVYFFSTQKKGPIGKQILALIISTICLIFCSPIGLTWLERSQTELFMASAYLMTLKAMRDGKPLDFVFAGVLASLKFSSLPFIAMAGVAYVLLSKNKVRSASLILLALAIPFLLQVPFGTNSIEYFRILKEWELGQPPTGISLSMYLPHLLAKIAPLSVPLLYVFINKSISVGDRYFDRSLLEFIFWCICGFVAGTFGSVVFEYKTVSLLFLIPQAIDGRSIFFGQESLGFGKRMTISFFVLAYSLRVNLGLSFWESFLNSNRGLKPLVAGLCIFIAAKLYSFLRQKMVAV